MEKRKTYVEQMTSYINDRIRELNKVKGELEQENRWIQVGTARHFWSCFWNPRPSPNVGQVSNERIAELAQKEKLRTPVRQRLWVASPFRQKSMRPIPSKP